MKLRLTLGCVVLFAATCYADPSPPGRLFVGGYRNASDESEVWDYNLATATLNKTISDSALNRPNGAAIGPDGMLYVTAILTSEIRRYNPVTGALIDVFADSSDGLSGPMGIALGPDNNFYVCQDVTDGEVRKIDGTTGADLGAFMTGPASAGRIYSDLVFIPDVGDVSANGYDLYLSSGAGGGNRGVFRHNGTTGALEANLINSTMQPTALLADDNYLYVGDARSGDPRIRRYTLPSGPLSIVVDTAPGTAMGLDNVKGLAFDRDGNLLASSFGGAGTYDDKVLRIDVVTGAYINDFAAVPNPTFLLMVPTPSTLLLLTSALGAWLAFARRQ